jgi:type IV pilus assembly protein PilM
MQLNPLSNAFGLDVGDRSLKIIQTVRGRGHQSYRVTAWGSVDLPEGAIDRGEIISVDTCVEALNRLLKECHGKLRGRAVVACLPEVKSFIKIIEVPQDASEAVINKAVTMELEQNIPLPLEDIYHDWQVLGERPVAEAEMPATKTGETAAPAATPATAEKTDEIKDEAPPDAAPGPKTMRVLIGASPKVVIDGYALMLERANLVPVALEIEATAIARAIVPAKNDEAAIGIIDIGATRSALIIYDAGVIQMSISIPISGFAITKLVSDSLKVSMADAELLKVECGLDVNRCEDKMWRILNPLIEDITEKIRNALRFYKIGVPGGKKIETLYLCGGGAQFREIDTVLSRKLALKVTRANPLVNIDPRLPKGFPSELTLNYTTALGLAIRAADEITKYRSSFS